MKSECSKLAQVEYKTRHDWVGKVIYSKLCKKLKFNHTNKRYMHNPEFEMENETNKLLRDFEIKAGHLILANRPDVVIIKKKKNNKIK